MSLIPNSSHLSLSRMNASIGAFNSAGDLRVVHNGDQVPKPASATMALFSWADAIETCFETF